MGEEGERILYSFRRGPAIRNAFIITVGILLSEEAGMSCMPGGFGSFCRLERRLLMADGAQGLSVVIIA